MEIIHKPIKQIKITTLHPCSIEFLAKKEAISHPPALLWCNGFLFTGDELDNDEIQQSELLGIQHFSTVCYFPLEDYKDHVGSGCYCCDVHNVTGNPVYEALTKYLESKKND